MLPAPTLSKVLEHSKLHPEALCCLLFAPPFSKSASEAVIPRLGYLNHRTAQYIDFHCAGYGGYWREDDYPDMELIGDVRYEDGTIIPWAFSQKAFSDFVNELEKATKWRYSGETEVIILNALKLFEDCLILDIDTMIKDNAINRTSELFESLIQYSRSNESRATAYQYSDSKTPNIFGRAVLDVLSEGPKALGKTWKSGRHFAVKSIAAPNSEKLISDNSILIGREHSIEETSEVPQITPKDFAPNLFKAVKAQLQAGESDNSADLLQIDKISVLKASVLEISDLRGIEICIGLTELHLEGNRINTLRRISVLTNLRKLFINQNQIIDISPIASLKNLTMLTLGSNAISDISPLRGLLKLKYLYLSMNRISDIRPLLDNCDAGGIGEGTSVFLSRNPLNRESIVTHIPYLKSRGVKVCYHN
jgi:Leucine Rich repeats (2 copies)